MSGQVTSGEDAAPLPGVNILVKGTTDGTISDANGNYTINVPNLDATLNLFLCRLPAQEVALGGRTAISVALASDAKQLAEVVVTALGIEKDKSKLGYAVQDVKGSDLVKARDPNPINNLAGKIAGLTVAGTPELLGRPQLYLRGKRPSLRCRWCSDSIRYMEHQPRRRRIDYGFERSYSFGACMDRADNMELFRSRQNGEQRTAEACPSTSIHRR